MYDLFISYWGYDLREGMFKIFSNFIKRRWFILPKIDKIIFIEGENRWMKLEITDIITINLRLNKFRIIVLIGV
jgi:hypothetical protein